MTNAQKENENAVLTSEKQDKSDALVQTLRGLTIIDAGYYESYPETVNESKGNPARNPKIATH